VTTASTYNAPLIAMTSAA